MTNKRKIPTLRDRFEALRERKRPDGHPPITWKHLANELNVARPYLYAMLAGEKTNPRPWLIKNMAKLLECPTGTVQQALARTKELAARRGRS
jgi:hypothetical protein